MYLTDPSNNNYYNYNGDTSIAVSADWSGAKCTINVRSGVTLNNVKFYPMLRFATESDPTYEPYYVPLKDVVPQKCDNTVIAPTENGTTASQAYAVGSHAIRNGAFITWKNAKAQGETINDESDYTSGTVGDYINYSFKTSLTTINANSFAVINIPEITGYVPFIVTPTLLGSGVSAYAIPKVLHADGTEIPNVIAVTNIDAENSHSWIIKANIIYLKN
jgi:hypothetical protein